MIPLLNRLLPTPAFLTAPVAGVDFSDATMRFLRLEQHISGLLPVQFGTASIPEGCMQGGRIIDETKFTSFLSQIKHAHKLNFVRVAIPESQVYSFTITLDIAAVADIKGAIELIIEDNIPLKAVETVFDYHILAEKAQGIVVQVSAVAEAVVETLLECFSQADLKVVGFELDGQSIARALIPRHDNGSYMVVDFGAKRTGITIISSGTAVYTSTLEFGGRNLLQTLATELHISLEEADDLKKRYGLTAIGEHKNIFSILAGGLSTVRDEINRRYVYWHEKRAQMSNVPPIDTVYLCGGHSNMRGLCDYLSASLKLHVVPANPWINCVSFDHAIPELSYDESMSYVTTIGLSLADYPYD